MVSSICHKGLAPKLLDLALLPPKEKPKCRQIVTRRWL
jgi:hypothetical protein